MGRMLVRTPMGLFKEEVITEVEVVASQLWIRCGLREARLRDKLVGLREEVIVEVVAEEEVDKDSMSVVVSSERGSSLSGKQCPEEGD